MNVDGNTWACSVPCLAYAYFCVIFGDCIRVNTEHWGLNMAWCARVDAMCVWVDCRKWHGRHIDFRMQNETTAKLLTEHPPMALTRCVCVCVSVCFFLFIFSRGAQISRDEQRYAQPSWMKRRLSISIVDVGLWPDSHPIDQSRSVCCVMLIRIDSRRPDVQKLKITNHREWFFFLSFRVGSIWSGRYPLVICFCSVVAPTNSYESIDWLILRSLLWFFLFLFSCIVVLIVLSERTLHSSNTRGTSTSSAYSTVSAFFNSTSGEQIW